MYRGKCRAAVVAVKVPVREIDEDQLEEFKQEVQTMTSISHPRLAMFLGAYVPAQKGERLMILMELLSGDMETILKRDLIPRRLSLFQRIEWIAQAAEGLAWLHGANLIHRDLKPSNLLYHAPSRSVKVADFGLAGILGKGEVLEDGRMVGNPRYWAPEVIDRQPWTRATDVYAWGVTCVSFVTRGDVFEDYASPVDGSMRLEFLTDVLENGLRPELPTAEYLCPEPLRELLERCWSRDVAARPSFADILDSMERHVLVRCAIPDKTGAAVWVKEACNITGRPGLQKEVTWEQMQKLLFNSAQSKGVVDMNSDEGHRLALLLYRLWRNEWGPFGEEICTLVHFGRVLGFFPKDDQFGSGGGGWARRALHMCQQKWFWGDSNRMEVEQHLRLSKPGTFVIRFANEASFRLSIHLGGKDVQSFYIEHTYQSSEYKVPHAKGLENQVFTDLHELATAVGKTFNLEVHAPERSPFLW